MAKLISREVREVVFTVEMTEQEFYAVERALCVFKEASENSVYMLNRVEIDRACRVGEEMSEMIATWR